MPDTTKNPTNDDSTATFKFKNGALAQLKEAASILGLPDDQNGLGQVLMKGIKFIQLAKKNKVVIDSETERVEVDLERL